MTFRRAGRVPTRLPATFLMGDIMLHSIALPTVDTAARPVTLISRIGLWFQNARTRAQLREAEDCVLLDIGITRDEALLEAAKPFWQNLQTPIR